MITRIEGNILNSNVYVVSNGTECFIVDAGAPIEMVKNVVGKQKVLAILLTHGHYDHIYFLDDYIREFACKVYESEFAKEYLCSAEKNASKDCPYSPLEVKEWEKTNTLSGNGVLKLGSFEIRFFQLGGHSRGDEMYDLDGNIFVGDVVIGRDVGRTDLYGGDKNAMIKSLEFLENYDYHTMLSGHGEEREKSTQNNVIKIWKKFLSR